MSRILKKKRFISFILALFISFSVLTNLNKKEAQAFDFVVTPTILWTLGSLVVATGVVALNSEQVLDMGQMVVDKVGDISQFIEGQKIQLGFNLLNKILEVASEIPLSNKVVNSSVPIGFSSQSITMNSSNYTDFSHYSAEVMYKESNGYSFTFANTTNSYQYVFIGNSKAVYIPGNSTIIAKTIYGKVTSLHTNAYRLGMAYYNVTNDSYDYTVWGSSYDDYKNGNYIIKFPGESLIDSSISVDIPYSNPLVRENYSPDVLPSNIPLEGDNIGVVTIPNALPSVSISADTPYDWSISKDIIGYDVIPNVGDIDKPGVGDIDKPGVGDIDTPIDRPIDGVVDDIYNPTFSTNLDLSPLYIDLTKKFPFSIPFDFLNLIKNFSVTKERPVVKITFPEKYYNSYTMDIDLAFYDDYFPFSSILRYFLLIAFMYFLMKNTRKIMGA